MTHRESGHLRARRESTLPLPDGQLLYLDLLAALIALRHGVFLSRARTLCVLIDFFRMLEPEVQEGHELDLTARFESALRKFPRLRSRPPAPGS